MPKHKKLHGPGQRTQPPSDPGREAWPSRIESLIARGKSRDAVEAAKQYLKGSVSKVEMTMFTLPVQRHSD